MTHRKSGRPAASECGEYYGKYIALVPGDDIVAALDHELTSALFLLRAVSAAQAEHRYADIGGLGEHPPAIESGWIEHAVESDDPREAEVRAGAGDEGHAAAEAEADSCDGDGSG